ncbi:MAG: aldo/keto reductase [Candidatus Hydrogenedentes bacterium]|nr:aldo/keto reductase [Candidatus Hydrogenedentota bacterium]
MGTATFGSEIDRATSFAVLDAYVEGGGNFIDTAHIYAACVKDGWGASERTVGEWLKAHGARDTFVIATKGGHPPMDNMANGRCDRAALEQDLDDSLERLGIDCVDLYWLHRDDPARPVEETLDTLAGFVRARRIRAYGVSNWTPARIDAARACAKAKGLPAPAASQIGWALADHPTRYAEVSPMVYMDDAFFRWHVTSQLPLAAYSAQATGYFGETNAAWALGGFHGPAPHGKGFDSPHSRKRLLAAISLARQKGCTPTQIALAYLLHQPFHVSPIASSSHPERIRDALEATAVSLMPDEVASLAAGLQH